MAHRSVQQGMGVWEGKGLGLGWDRWVGRLFPEEVIGSSHGNNGAAPNAEIALGQAGWALTVLFAPPGLAVDYHNERLYWADAKLSVIGSIRLNGTDPIVAADSKRGQRPPAASASPDLTLVSVFPSEPQASLSTCQPPQPGPQQSFLFCFVFCFFVLLGPHLQHVGVPRPGVESEL